MRVCLLTPEFLPTWGGVGTYTYNVARGLRDRAEVHVVTSGHGADDVAAVAPEGVQVHTILPDGAHDGGLGLSFQLAVLRRLPALCRTHRFDIVHANHAYMSDLLVRMRRLRARRALTVHTTLGTQVLGTLRADGGVPRDGRERSIERWRLLFGGIERRYLRQTPAMIFVSRWVRDHATARYRLAPRVAAVIPNGVDMKPLADGTPLGGDDREDDRPMLLFAGRLLALKGIDTLLKAMVRLDAHVRLVLAGPGDPSPWTSYADGLGLDRDRYEFLGPVPYPMMPSLYRSADAVVLPSFSESCPMVALEAMACGTPLIAASAGGVAEIVQDGETGWLFPPGDVDALVGRIETVLSDPIRARQTTARARTWVKEHASIERMADRTLEFYDAVCGEAS